MDYSWNYSSCSSECMIILVNNSRNFPNSLFSSKSFHCHLFSSFYSYFFRNAFYNYSIFLSKISSTIFNKNFSRIPLRIPPGICKGLVHWFFQEFLKTLMKNLLGIVPESLLIILERNPLSSCELWEEYQKEFLLNVSNFFPGEILQGILKKLLDLWRNVDEFTKRFSEWYLAGFSGEIPEKKVREEI